MANFGQLILTNVGIQEQYKAQTGKEMKFKRIGMGSGTYTGNIMALTKLVKENVSVDISKGYIQNNAFTVEGFFSNEGLQTGFAWREIGVFVEDENGNEVLYCYANAGDAYDFIPATSDERYSKYIRVATAIGNATNVSIVENEGILYVDYRTFNDSVLELQTAVDTLQPSKEEVGAIITADDSAKLPFAKMKVYGKSEQIATTGAQLIQQPYEGTDMTANGVTFTINTDRSVTVTGAATGNTYFTLNGGYAGHASIPDWLKEGNNYTISGGTTEIGVMLFLYKDGGDTVTFAAYGNSTTFVMPSGYDYYGIFIQVASGKTVNTIIRPMLNEGHAAKEYEVYSGGAPAPSPNYPQEIVGAGDKGNIKVEIYGKNLFDCLNASKVLGNSTVKSRTESQMVITGNTMTWQACCFPLPEILEGHVITVSGKWTTSGQNRGCLRVQWVNSVGTTLGDIIAIANTSGQSATGRVSKKPENAKYLCLFVYSNSDGNGIVDGDTVTYTNIQVEASDTATEFEAYKAPQSLIVSAPNGLLGIPVSSGGNYTDADGQQWVCDEIDLMRGVKVQRIKGLNLSEVDKWGHDGTWSNPSAFFASTALNGAVQVSSYFTVADIMCNRLINDTPNNISKGNNGKIAQGGGNGVYVSIEGIESSDDLVSYFAENETIVYYILATPIETALTDAEISSCRALHSNNPTTTIFNDAGADMGVEYVTKAFEGALNSVTKNLLNKESAVDGSIPDANTFVTTGIHKVNLTSAIDAEGKHYPYVDGNLVVIGDGTEASTTSFITQMFFSTDRSIYSRTSANTGSTWTKWAMVYTEAFNFNPFSVDTSINDEKKLKGGAGYYALQIMLPSGTVVPFGVFDWSVGLKETTFPTVTFYHGTTLSHLRVTIATDGSITAFKRTEGETTETDYTNFVVVHTAKLS